MVFSLVNSAPELRMFFSVKRAEGVLVERIKINIIIELFKLCLSRVGQIGDDVDSRFIRGKTIKGLNLGFFSFLPVINGSGFKSKDPFWDAFLDLFDGAIKQFSFFVRKPDDGCAGNQVVCQVLSGRGKAEDAPLGVSGGIIGRGFQVSPDAPDNCQVLSIEYEVIPFFPDRAKFFGQVILALDDLDLGLVSQEKSGHEEDNECEHGFSESVHFLLPWNDVESNNLAVNGSVYDIPKEK